MKKIIALLMVLIMVLGLVACGAKAPAADAPAADAPVADAPAADAPAVDAPAEESFEGKTLTIAFATGDTIDGYQAQIDAFCAEYGCEIEVEYLTGDATENANTLFLRAATGNLPDIFKLSSGQSIITNLDPETNLVDLAGQPFLENITDAYLDVVTDENGHVWSIPTETSNVAGVFYNKQVLADLGLEIPTTWAEFLETCQWLRDNTDMDPVIHPFDGAAGKQILYLAQYYYVQNEDPEFVYKYAAREMNLHESPAFMRGLTKLADLYNKGYQNRDPLSTSMENVATALVDGSAAFVICRTNLMSTMQTVAPENVNDIGFFPMPDEKAEDLGVAVWMPTGWYLSQTCEEQALALKFFEYLTSAEAVEAYCSKITPTGAFMLKTAVMPENVSVAVSEAQEWAAKSSSPVMEYFLNFKGRNLPDLVAMVGTGELTPDEAITMIEDDFKLNAEQNGVW